MSNEEQKDRSFVARFGATIVRGGIASIPQALYRYQGELGLSAQQTWFVSAILARKWDSEMPMPSLKQMAEQSGVSRVSLHNYQRELIQAGWLRVINRQNAQGGKDTNIFDFEPLFRRLEELLIRDRDGENAHETEDKYTPHVNTSLHTHVNPSEHAHVSPSLHVKESVFKETTKESFNISNIRKSNSSKDDFVDNSTSHPNSSEGPQAGPKIWRGVEDIGEVIKRKRGRPRKYSDEVSQTILNYVADFAREFADKATVNQSAARFINDYHKWGKGDMDAFIGILYQARSLTKSQPGVKKKFAYFAEVVEDLLGLRESQANLSLPN